MDFSGSQWIAVLALVIGQAVTDPDKGKGKKKLRIQEIEIFHEDPNYCEVTDCEVKYRDNDDTAVWSMKLKIYKELSDTSLGSLESFRKDSNGWGSYIYRFPETLINKFLESEAEYKAICATGNFPPKFPFSVGEYSINQYNFNHPSNLDMECNDYYFEINLTVIESINKVNVLGMRLYINIRE